MDYQFWFWMLAAFLAGRVSKWRVYVGPDKEKYKNADVGLLIR